MSNFVLGLRRVARHIGNVLTRRQFAGPDWPRLVADRIIVGLPLLRFLHYSLTEE